MSDTSSNLLSSEDKENAADVIGLAPEAFQEGDDVDSEPEITRYRWIILATFGLTMLCVGAISSYYNYLAVFLVDV